MDPLYLRKLKIDRQILNRQMPASEQKLPPGQEGKMPELQQQPQTQQAQTQQTQAPQGNKPVQEEQTNPQRQLTNLSNQSERIMQDMRSEMLSPKNLKMNYLASIERSSYVKKMMNLPESLPELLIKLQNPEIAKDVRNVLMQPIPEPDTQRTNKKDNDGSMGYRNPKNKTKDEDIEQKRLNYPQNDGFKDVLKTEDARKQAILRHYNAETGVNNVLNDEITINGENKRLINNQITNNTQNTEKPNSSQNIVGNNKPAIQQTTVVNNTPIVNEQPVTPQTPVVNNNPVVNEQPVVQQTPIVNNNPIVNEQPVAQPTPVVNNNPIVNEQPVVQQTPIVNNNPIVNEQPVVQQTPVVNNNPVVNEQPVIPQTPVVNNNPVVNEQPVIQPTPVVNNNPVINEQPVIQPMPVVNNNPVVNEQPVVQQTPIVNNNPILNEQPVIQQTPVVNNNPIVNEQHAVQPTPVVNNNPVVNEQLVIQPTPVVNNNPVVNEQPVVQPTSVVNNNPVINEQPVIQPTPVMNKNPVVNEQPVVQQTPVVNNNPIVNEQPVVQPNPIQNTPIIEGQIVYNDSPEQENINPNNQKPITTPEPPDKNNRSIITDRHHIDNRTSMRDNTRPPIHFNPIDERIINDTNRQIMEIRIPIDPRENINLRQPINRHIVERSPEHIPEHEPRLKPPVEKTEVMAELYANLSANDMTNPTMTQMRQRLSDDALELLFTGLINLKELSQTIKHGGHDARSKLILAMANASKQGIDNSQITTTMKMVSESMAAEENRPSQILKNIMMLYLPWYPLPNGVGFNLSIETLPGNSDFSSLLKVYIQTRNYGNVNGSLVLLTGNTVDMNIQCNELFPKDNLLDRMKDVTDNHTMQSNITVEERAQMAHEFDNQEASVNMSSTYELNPFLLLMAHSFIKNTIIIDSSAGVVS